MNRIQKLAINCGLVFFGIFVACCVAEVALRVLNIEPSEGGFPQYYFQKTDYGYDITPNFTPHPMLIDGCYKCNVWSNEIGCFDYSIKHFQGNKNTILLLGDSFTWGYTDFNDKWGTLIEKLCSFPVLKCGVAAYGPKQQYIKGRKVLNKFKADIDALIIGYYVGNDLEDDYLYPHRTVCKGYLVGKVRLVDIQSGKKKVFSEQEIKEKMNVYEKFGTVLPFNPSPFDKMKAFLKHNLVLYRILVPRIKEILMKLGLYNLFCNVGAINQRKIQEDVVEFYDYTWIKEAWKEHFNNLLAFKDFCREKNRKLVFIIIPTKVQVYPELLKCGNYYDRERIDLSRPNRILSQFFQKNNIIYFDLLPLFRFYARKIDSCFLDREKDLYWKYDGHWNVRGNHLAGLLVSKYLLKHNIITVPDKQEKIAKIDKQLMEEFGKLPPENLL